MQRTVQSTLLTLFLASSVLLPGCQSDAGTGALIGAGLGALAGQAIGGDSEATRIGAGAGAGIGYILGNERDKAKAEEMNAERLASARATSSSGASTRPASFTHDETGTLGGTRWSLLSLYPQDIVDPYTSKVIEFQPTGYVTTTTTLSSGKVRSDEERYRVVDSVLIVNGDEFLINATYSISGDQMVVTANEFQAVLQRL